MTDDDESQPVTLDLNQPTLDYAPPQPPVTSPLMNDLLDFALFVPRTAITLFELQYGSFDDFDELRWLFQRPPQQPEKK